MIFLYAYEGSWEDDPAEKMGESRRPLEPEPDNTGGGKNMSDSIKTGSQTKILAEIIVLSALSAVLYTIRPFSLPYGGSVTLGSMVPVLWLALRRGAKIGLLAGAVFGILALFIDVMLVGAGNIIASPIQVFLEYPIAFGVLGLAGLFHKKPSTTYAIAGVATSVFIKFLVHYLVGAFIWVSVYAFPPEWGQWLWPAVYNGSFLLVEFIVSFPIIAILVKRGTLEYSI